MKNNKDNRKYIITLIYKEYGRSRGCRDSAEAFAEYLEEIVNKESLKIETQLINVNNLRDFVFNKSFKESILFNICFIQDPEQRGLYEVIKTRNDIVFCKDIIDKKTDYIQDFRTIIWKGVQPHRYFPKYYGTIYKRDRNSSKRVYYTFTDNRQLNIDINYCWYNRKDISPTQTAFYNKFITELINNYPVPLDNLLKDTDVTSNNFVQAFGYNNDSLLVDIFNKCDVILYTAPDHLDPFPNTIFQALVNNLAVIEIPNPNTGKTDPGFQALKEYFPHKVYSVDKWMEYTKTKFWHFGIYNENGNISSIARFEELTNGSINKFLLPEEYAVKVFKSKLEETKSKIEKHVLKLL